MKMTNDIQAMVEPIGILPEAAYGIPLVGFDIDGVHLAGVSSIKITPNLTVYNSGGYTVDEDYFIGLRIKIIRVSQGTSSIHIITAMTGSPKDHFTIEPALPTDLENGDDIYLIAVPIQRRVRTADNELDTGRSVEGVVGGGMYKTEARQGGKTGKLRLESIMGSDFFKYGDLCYAYSCLKAYCLTANGKIRTVGGGSITPRGSITPTSDIKSFTTFYPAKSGKNRILKGCIVSKDDMAFDESIQSSAQGTDEIQYKDITPILPYHVLPPDAPYTKYALRAHGHLTLNYWPMTYFAQPAVPAAGTIYLKGVVGLDLLDAITLTHKATGFTFDTVIQTIDSTNKYITINPVLPGVYNWTEDDTVEVKTNYSKPHRIIKMDLSFNNGGVIYGDLRTGSDSPTHASANGSDYGGSIQVDREDDQDIWQTLMESNENIFFKMDATLQHHPLLIDFYIRFVAKIRNNPKETMKAEMETIKDEISFQIVDIEELAIADPV